MALADPRENPDVPPCQESYVRNLNTVVCSVLDLALVTLGQGFIWKKRVELLIPGVKHTCAEEAAPFKLGPQRGTIRCVGEVVSENTAPWEQVRVSPERFRPCLYGC